MSNLAMGLALLLLATGGTLHAQVNPATVKNQAQNGVNQSQQTHPPAQGQTQGHNQTKPPTQTPPKTQTQNQSTAGQQTTTKQTNPPAKSPANPPVTPGAKSPSTNPTKPPATQGQQPPKTSATNDTAKQKQKNAPPKTTPPKTAQTNHPAPAGPPAKQTPPKTNAKTPAKTPATETTASRPPPPPVRRDPFVMLVGKRQGGSGGEMVRLPPGKAGLQVNTLVIKGILSSPSGMIVVVANPQRSVYFLHVGDQLFDGSVERIEIDGVTFHEVGKDAFGKPIERQVTRKLNPSLGEQP
jgi:Tfp pilus assembly protein PilP